jgi:hypothetical protein
VSRHENYRAVNLSVFVTVCYVTIDIPIACCLHSSFYSVLRSIKIDENIVIKKVLANPFSVRPLRATCCTATVHVTKSNTQNIFALL